MTWLPDVDSIRRYVANLPHDFPIGKEAHPSRKVIYAWIADGMRCVRLGESGRDIKGRNRQGRIIGATEWVDAYLVEKSESKAVR